MRALVTGGCGFIGSNLVHRLVQLGWKVDVVDDMSNGHIGFLNNLNIRTVQGFLLHAYEQTYESEREEDCVLIIQDDFESRKVLDRVENGKYDVVFHLAANPRVSYSIEHPASTFDVNVTRTISLIESVNKCKSHVRFVFSSTSAVYGNVFDLPTSESAVKDPLSPYGLQKLTIENFLKLSSKLYKTDSICLRYANVYGPRQLGNSPYSTAISSWCQKVYDDQPLRSDGDGYQTRDMIYVDDVVEANVLAAQSKNRFTGDAINIGTQTTVSNNHILELFKEKFGDRVKVQHAPERVGDVRHTELSNAKAYYTINWEPKITLTEGLQRTWAWWRQINENK